MLLAVLVRLSAEREWMASFLTYRARVIAAFVTFALAGVNAPGGVAALSDEQLADVTETATIEAHTQVGGEMGPRRLPERFQSRHLNMHSDVAVRRVADRVCMGAARAPHQVVGTTLSPLYVIASSNATYQ